MPDLKFCAIGLFVSSLVVSTGGVDAQDLSGTWKFHTGSAESSWTLSQSGSSVSGSIVDPAGSAQLNWRLRGSRLSGLMTYPSSFSFPTPGILVANGNSSSLSGTWYEWLILPRQFSAQRSDAPQPTGLLVDGFETGAPSTEWSFLTNIEGTSSPGADVIGFVESGVARSGNYALRIRYSQDEQVAKLEKALPIGEEGQLYVRYWQMFPAGFNQRNLKQTRIFVSEGAQCGTIEGSSELLFWGNIPGQQMVAAAYRCNEDAIGEYFDYTFAPGEWVKVAMFVKYNNPPGAANGIFRVWRNDQVVLNRTNVVYLKDQAKAVTDGVWIGGNYSGAGTAPVPFDRYLDDIYIAWSPDGDIPEPAMAPVQKRMPKARR